MSKRLGKGLGALIPELEIGEEDKVIEIPLNQLRANPYQPRKHFNEDGIQELASSIKEHGVIQPIIVRTVLKGYEIIAGERRFRASQASGLATIPAVVKKLSDQQVMEIALIENVQREDLNAMEIAIAYQAIIDQFSLTQEELSVKVGKSRSHIANFLRLLHLPESIKQYVSRGTLSMGHARAIVGVKDDKVKKELTDACIGGQWSVRQLEEEIKRREELGSEDKEKPKVKDKKKDPYLHQAEEQLQDHYRTTVRIKHQNYKGRIELMYYSKDDLERLLEMLQGQIS
ncbi:ParB/RepB/Spo0J family partition protein [Paenibacillus chitinolyticus]|uniref:ParB/RepB/Spo0J family partition protein n=1 Tax=Paenibacillus chitinolyticus TaxID=79263 RepID=A0A410WQD1_9BACL|nr:ParB/RepB/Spo0J family partition protein [Paenibacillus chitinolyticus]MCY9593926.1 ParB/RepB/Spo0J family partition protein [Paenibacillus chitinolyticus]MCY9599545.1 ParB/RepB/Spo0J family partition protein [Paenibacillus chitinolyticus]QAV16544.1 stage 0 sporulation protein J [Paenibacillus chitinolyticus]